MSDGSNGTTPFYHGDRDADGVPRFAGVARRSELATVKDAILIARHSDQQNHRLMIELGEALRTDAQTELMNHAVYVHSRTAALEARIGVLEAHCAALERRTWRGRWNSLMERLFTHMEDGR